MLETKGLVTVEDLLAYAPFRYEDRTNIKTIAQLAPGEMATVVADLQSAHLRGFRRRNIGLFEAIFKDASKERLLTKWFHGGYLVDRFLPGVRAALYGKVELDNYTGDLLMMHPEFEILTTDDSDGDAALDASLHTGRIVPVYEAAGKVTTRAFRSLVHRVRESIAPLDDDLPACASG
jgi:ATP-dependent DNA helicase RecG